MHPASPMLAPSGQANRPPTQARGRKGRKQEGEGAGRGGKEQEAGGPRSRSRKEEGEAGGRKWEEA